MSRKLTSKLVVTIKREENRQPMLWACQSVPLAIAEGAFYSTIANTPSSDLDLPTGGISIGGAEFYCVNRGNMKAILKFIGAEPENHFFICLLPGEISKFCLPEDLTSIVFLCQDNTFVDDEPADLTIIEYLVANP